MKIFVLFLLNVPWPMVLAKNCTTNLCGSHGACYNGHCLCDLFYYGMYCENEMNSTSKVTIVDSGMQVDFLPLLITLFMFGLPLLWALGLLCLDRLTRKRDNLKRIFDLENQDVLIGTLNEKQVKKVHPEPLQSDEINAKKESETISNRRKSKNNTVMEFQQRNFLSGEIKKEEGEEQNKNSLFNNLTLVSNKKKLEPLPDMKKNVSFNFSKSGDLDEKAKMLDNLELNKLKSFKERIMVLPFYNKEAEKFVKINDEINDVMEFLKVNMEEHFKTKNKKNSWIKTKNP